MTRSRNHALLRLVRRLARLLPPLSLGFVATTTACGLVSAERKQEAAEAGYTSALLRCVDKAETIAQARACRADTRAQWGVASPNATPIAVDAGTDAR